MVQPTETCPHCGATFRRGRLACPECGSDAETGWRSSEDIDYESIELPEHDGPEAAAKPRFNVLGALVVLLVLALVVLFALRW